MDKSTHPWKRHRFKANYPDYRPVKFPPPGPYWCSGSAGDDSYSIVIAFLPRDVRVEEYWPEARDDEATEERDIVFTDRFSKPKWWDDTPTHGLAPQSAAAPNRKDE